MSVLVVGGDHLGNIEENLKEKGFSEVNHISGRKKKQKSCKVPQNTDVVLILTDYVNHQTTQNIKKQIKNSNTKMLYSRRAWSYIDKTLNRLNFNS